ncbi:hypothetical protein EVAR_73298_1 [Eumeta japonica]|uniref:Uncharacterized protein n=1 Tax=Eumeta variegata TaxID=151549 RepID=A0A4C1ST87_EUMVA|nr:hypothetical protein EVAR_73298_1 [Eumeta japonica]
MGFSDMKKRTGPRLRSSLITSSSDIKDERIGCLSTRPKPRGIPDADIQHFGLARVITMLIYTSCLSSTLGNQGASMAHERARAKRESSRIIRGVVWINKEPVMNSHLAVSKVRG